MRLSLLIYPPLFSLRLSSLQQPYQLHHCAKAGLLRRGGSRLLHFLPQDSLLQTQQTHYTLFLQRGGWGQLPYVY